LTNKKVDNRKVKCPYCEEQLYRRNAIKHTNNRYYHEECYEEVTRESREYKELIDTICRIWNIKAPTMQMVSQLKRYREDPDLQCTNKGMQLTLEYYYDLLGNKPEADHGVGIIPWNYDKAKEQYIRQREIYKSFEEYEEEEARKIYISPRSKREQSKRYKAIDIESL